MRSVPATAALLAAVLLATAPALAAVAPGGMSVVVLYFDNNTNDRSYDVLQKGLADMMVTDLSGSGRLQVVEREKLQKLLDELKLQRSRYFDPATAQRIGKGIGATYAVTGSITAFDPTVRIDVRLIEVATAKVTMAEKVVGSKDHFFDLEAELAQKFLAALDGKGQARPSGIEGGADIETVLAYSKGLDAADRGDLDAASKALAGVVNRAPRFKLAQDRYASIMKRLYEARAHRDQILGSGEDVLLKNAREALAHPESLSDERTAQAYLAYRILMCQHLFLSLGRTLGLKPDQMDTSTAVQVPPALRAAAAAGMRAHVDELRKLYKELLQVEAGRTRGGSVSFRLPADDHDRATAIGIKNPGEWSFATSWRVARAAAQFALSGKPDFWMTVKFPVAPSLAEMDPSVVEPSLKLLDEALAGIEKGRLPNEQMRQRDSIDTLDLYAQLLMRLGRRTEAIARWQTILDRYPTCEKYAEYERDIQDALGIAPADPAFQDALQRCDPMALTGPWAQAAVTRAQKTGPAVYDELADEVEQRCGKDARFQPMADVFWFSAGTVALSSGGACPFARRMVERVGNSDSGRALRPQLEKSIAEKCR